MMIQFYVINLDQLYREINRHLTFLFGEISLTTTLVSLASVKQLRSISFMCLYVFEWLRVPLNCSEMNHTETICCHQLFKSYPILLSIYS